MKKGIAPAPRESSDCDTQVAYDPLVSAIPIMNGVIWCQVP